MNLKTNRDEINILLKYRTENHQLEVRTDSYRKRKNYEESVCNICNNGKVENQFHFLVECSAQDEIRLRSFLVEVSKEELYDKMHNITNSRFKIARKLFKQGRKKLNQ